MRATNQETRCGDERAGGDDEHPDAIDRRADDFHELAKIFHRPDFISLRTTISILRLIGQNVATGLWRVRLRCLPNDRGINGPPSFAEATACQAGPWLQRQRSEVE